MTSYDMEVINNELAKALAIADLLTNVDEEIFSDTVVNEGLILTDILVGIKARLEKEEGKNA